MYLHMLYILIFFFLYLTVNKLNVDYKVAILCDNPHAKNQLDRFRRLYNTPTLHTDRQTDRHTVPSINRTVTTYNDNLCFTDAR